MLAEDIHNNSAVQRSLSVMIQTVATSYNSDCGGLKNVASMTRELNF